MQLRLSGNDDQYSIDTGRRGSASATDTPLNLNKMANYFAHIAAKAGIELSTEAKANLPEIIKQLQKQPMPDNSKYTVFERLLDLLTYHGRQDHLSVGQSKLPAFFKALLNDVKLDGHNVAGITEKITNNLNGILYPKKLDPHLIDKKGAADVDLLHVQKAEQLQRGILNIVSSQPATVETALKNVDPEWELSRLFYSCVLQYEGSIGFDDYNSLTPNSKSVFSQALQWTGPEPIKTEAEFRLALSRFQYNQSAGNHVDIGDEIASGSLGKKTFNLMFLNNINKDSELYAKIEQDKSPLPVWPNQAKPKSGKGYTIQANSDSPNSVIIDYKTKTDLNATALTRLAEQLLPAYTPAKGLTKQQRRELVLELRDYLTFYIQHVLDKQTTNKEDSLMIPLPGKTLLEAFGQFRREQQAQAAQASQATSALTPAVFRTTSLGLPPQVEAFLATIRQAESNDQYDVTFGFQKVDLSLGAHPERVVTQDGISSSAFGAYQFMPPTMKVLLSELSASEKKGKNLISPEMQDRLALQLLMDQGVSAELIIRDPMKAFFMIADQWAAIPTENNHSYYNTKGQCWDEYGGTLQSAKTIDQIKQMYQKNLQNYSKLVLHDA